MNYLQEGDDPPKLCPQPKSPDGYVQCTPNLFAAADDILFLSDSAGHFKDVTRAAGIGGKDGKGLGVVICDMDRDGWPGVCVANDGVHIGLGAMKFLPKLRIGWPSGETSEWTDIAAGHYVVVQRQGLYRLFARP